MDEFEPDLIETQVHVLRPIDGGVDVLRQFSAYVLYHQESDLEEIGQVHGWIGWSISEVDLADAGDAVSGDAEALGVAAVEIIDEYPDAFIDDALLIDRMWLDPKWRGRRLSGAIITDLMELLRLEPESTAVVLQPEPQDPDGGPYNDGVKRDEAMARLHAAYRASGLEPWDDSVVWWRPF